MNLLRSLHTNLTWMRILELLDIPVPGTTLPARTTCPLCRGHRFNIYEDNRSGSSWHYCFDCLFVGGPVELCAAVWKCTLAVAIRRLQRNGIVIPKECLENNGIQSYITFHAQTRDNMSSFWKQSCQNMTLPLSAYVGNLMSYLHLNNNIPLERWPNGPDRVIGLTHRSIVGKLFIPGRIRTGGSNRLFPGKGWGEMFAIAYNDMPERISGFLFVGRDARQEDHVFHMPDTRGRRQKERLEAGLAGLWTVDASKAACKDYVVAMADAYLAARLQLRGFATSDRPLPLVSYYDGPIAVTQHTWDIIAHRKVVVWGWRMIPSLVNQAIACNGLISLSEIPKLTHEAINHHLRHDEPRILMQHIIKKALPWRDALIAWAKVQSTAEIEELLLGLEVYKLDMEMIYNLSPCFNEARGVIEVPKEVCLGSYIVRERDGCWWFRARGGLTNRKETMLLEGVLRVENEFLEDGILIYCGNIIHQDGTKIPFKLPADRFHKNPLIALKVLAMLEDKQIYIAPDCGRKLIGAALLFQTPKFIGNTWDRSTAALASTKPLGR